MLICYTDAYFLITKKIVMEKIATKCNTTNIRYFSVLFFILLLLVNDIGWGQTTLATFNFENSDLLPLGGAIGSPTLTGSSTISYFGGSATSPTASACFASANGKYFELTINTTGYSTITVDWNARTSSTTSSWVVTADDGGGYGSTLATHTLTTSFTAASTLTLGSSFNNNSSIKIKWTANVSATQTIRIDDIVIKGTSTPSCTSPTTQASSFSTNTISCNSMNIAFTRGNGDGGVMVVAKAGSVPSDPASGTTYTANSVYGSGTACGGGFVVYNGTAAGTGNPTGNISISNLALNTTYYYAVYEYNTTGTCYNLTELTGNQTTYNLPTVTTTAISSLTSSSASSGGNVTSDGGIAVTARGVCWSTSLNPTISDSKTTDGSGTGSFASSITGLSSNTTYHVRAYATNTCGTSYGSDIEFTTPKPEPSNHLTALSCGTTTSSSIQINWTDATGGTLPENYLIKWNTTGTFSDPVDGTAQSDGAGVKNISQGTQTYNVTGLTQNTTYYFKIWPYTNSGSSINFKTDGTVPATNCNTQIIYSCGLESFSSAPAAPSGWTFTGITSTYATACSSSSPLKMDDSGDAIETATVTNPISLSFYILGNGTDASSALLVEGWNGAWNTIENLNNLPTACTKKTYTTGIGSYTKFRFTYTKSLGNLSFDDVEVLCQNCTPPTTQASVANFSSVLCNSMTINWTRGNGDNVLVIAKQGSAVNSLPVDGTTYTANAAFGSGTQIGTGNYVVYKGTGTSVNITGLTANTTYHFAIYEYNNTDICHKFFGLTANQTTNTTPTLTTTSISSISTSSSSSGGNITADGGLSVTARGVCWKTSTGPTISDSKTTDGSGTGSFASSLTGLNPQTRYFVKAYATNTCNTSYGSEVNFYTYSNAPTVQASALNVTCASGNALNLAWTSATFPGTGATNKGYVLLRAASPNTPILGSPNGQAPSAGANTTIVSSSISEATTTYTNSSLSTNTTYNYLLVPYCWDGTNSATYNYLTASAPTVSGTTASSSSDVVAVASSEQNTISSLMNDNAPLTSTTGVQVWQITVRDGGAGLNDSDNLPTIVTGISLAQAAGNTVDDWQAAIKTFEIFDGTTRIAAATVTPSQIQFTGLSISVTDNTSKTLSFRMSLNEAFSVNGNIDGDDFVFSLANTNFTTSTCGSSSKTTFTAAASTNDKNIIDVVASKLRFVQQPTDVGMNLTMSPSVTIEACDANNNRDLQFTSSIQITSSGTLVGTPLTSNAVAGIATFSSLVHSVAQTARTLTAKRSGTLDWTVNSNNFDILEITTINRGELAILAVNTNGTWGDEFTFVSFVDIKKLTAIDVTDNGYERENAGKWGDTEGTIRFTRRNSDLLKGKAVTVIMTDVNGFDSTDFSIYVDGVLDNANWKVTNLAAGTSGGFNFNSADQIWIMQGGEWIDGGSHNDTYSGNILFGWTATGWKTNIGTTPTTWTTDGSRLYPNMNCFNTNVQGLTNADKVKYTGDMTAATVREWIDRINTNTNWTGYADNTAYNAGSPDYKGTGATLTINPGGWNTGIWQGNNSTDWFTCDNWQDFSVPNQNTNVTVPTSGVTNNPTIGAPPTGFTSADCNNLSIESGRTLTINNSSAILHIYGNLVNNGTFTHTDGEVHFEGINDASISGTSSTTFYKLQINKSASSNFIDLLNDITISSELNMVLGKIKTNAFNTILSNTSSTSLINYSANSFIYGNLRRHIVSNTNTYAFPIGDGTTVANYKRLDYINNNLTGLTYLDVNVSSITESGNNIDSRLNIAQDGTPLINLLESAIWTINPQSGFSYSSGSYGVNLYVANTGLSATDDNKFCPVKRDNSSTDYADWNTFVATESTTIPAKDVSGRLYETGNGFAQRTGYKSFSKHAIAKGAEILPIELISFTAEYNKPNVELNWITSAEINNDFFTLEKSKDGITFIPFEQIIGAGNSNSIINYNSYDNNPYKGISYYRLKQTDFDGKYTYSNSVSVYVPSNDICNTWYNKNENSVFISFNSEIENNYLIRIFDITGKEVFKKETFISGIVKLCTAKNILSSGVYIITIESNKERVSERIIVN